MKFPIPPESEVQRVLGLADEPEHIGTGGFKAVYSFLSETGEKEVVKAVYIPPPGTDEEMLFREQMIARAKREVQALGACASPHLVKLGGIPAELHELVGHDYFVYGEEFLPGAPLSKRIGDDTLSYELLFSVFATLVELIEELVTIGYLHRDIKPDNIMDTGDPARRYVMLDLGIAYKMHGTALTGGGGPPGTLRYMAPELLKPDYKDNMDFRCDLYAAGLTIYVLASGTHPFAPQPEHEYATVYRIMKTTPTPLAHLCPHLPPEFCAVIDRCMRKKPALRYAKIDLLKNDLRRVAP